MDSGTQYYRDTYIEIRLDAVRNNLNNIQAALPKNTEIMAVVKANGYGHGAYEVATAAIESGASMLAVALLDEALQLRLKGITTPILVLGAVPLRHVPIAQANHIHLTLPNLEWLLGLKQIHLEGTLNLHLKIDTGMNRTGITNKHELDEILIQLESNRNVHLDGVYTHFATADEKDSPYFQQQIEKFRTYLKRIEHFGLNPRYIHCANSAAAIQLTEPDFNMVRIGILMYGLSPSKEMKSAIPFTPQPVMSLHSHLIMVKKVKKGSCLSYGCTYTAVEDEWVGTIPIGYADGWRRSLQSSNVLIGGEYGEIIGRICMDQLMIRLPRKFELGERVTLIGRQEGNEITADDVASHIGTINYEVTCMITSRVPRIFLNNESIMKVENTVL